MTKHEPHRLIMAPKAYGKNQHLASLYAILAEEGHQIVEFSVKEFFRHRGGIWHIHWINPFMRGTVSKFGIDKSVLLISLVRSVGFLFLMMLAKIRAWKILWSVHNVEMHSEVNPEVEAWITRLLLRWADRVTVFNNYIKNELERRYGFNGARLMRRGGYAMAFPERADRQQARKEFNVGADDFVLLFFGNVMYYKGVDLLIEAVHSIDLPDLKLIIAGSSKNEPDYGRSIEKLCNTAQDGRIIFMNRYVDHTLVPGLFAAADFAIYPYRKISNSGVLHLAIDMMTPVIISDRGGVSELFDIYGALGILLKTAEVAEIREAVLQAYHERPDFSAALQSAREGTDWQQQKSEVVKQFVF